MIWVEAREEKGQEQGQCDLVSLLSSIGPTGPGGHSHQRLFIKGDQAEVSSWSVEIKTSQK